MNTTPSTPPVDQPRLVRISAWYLDPQATCGLPPHYGSKDICGGELRVREWHPEGLRSGRYELYCAKCQTCDPNGHSRQDAVMSEGLEYLNANVKNQSPAATDSVSPTTTPAG